MKNYTFPNEVLEDTKISVKDYCISHPSSKNHVTLNQNLFSFLIEGHKEVIHFNAKTRINNQQFLLMKAGKYLMTEKILSLDNKYRSFLLFFDDEMLFRFIEKNKIKLQANLKIKPFFALEYDAYIKLFVESLIKLEPQNIILKQLLPTKFDELFLYLVNKYGSDFLSSFLTPQNNYNNHFMSVIENNILNNLTIEELAFLCNKSVSAFKREFGRVYNQSPIKWFQEKRLEHSAFLLEHKKLRPSDIYEEAGYESLSSFIQAYKKKFGVTPKKHF